MGPDLESSGPALFAKPTGLHMGQHIIFKCPQTGLNVQQWLDEPVEEAAEDFYQSVECPACTGIHFVNRRTGLVLGQE